MVAITETALADFVTSFDHAVSDMLCAARIKKVANVSRILFLRYREESTPTIDYVARPRRLVTRIHESIPV